MSELKTSKLLKENYDDYYKDGESEWRRLGALDKAANIVALCDRFDHGSILEIGAGDGSILERLSELNFGEELHAVEISTSGVETIRNRRIRGLVDCRVFDGYSLPYRNDQFDLAVLSHVVEHVEHPRQLIYESARVARYVFIEVPLEDVSRLRRDFTFDKVGHINFYSPRTIRWLVQTCGLRVIEQITTNSSKAIYAYRSGFKGVINYYIKQLLITVVPSLATKHLTYHGSLVCEKADR